MDSNITDVTATGSAEQTPATEPEEENSSTPEQEFGQLAIDQESPLGGTVINQAINPDSIFFLFVGPGLDRFAININDLRQESRLFAQATTITSIELRHENPAAVQLIQNWFSGHVGRPPMTTEARERYYAAARIARQLEIRECENQLMVIIHKTARELANFLYHQMADPNYHASTEEIVNRVLVALEGYMIRSPNVGGEDEDSDDLDA